MMREYFEKGYKVVVEGFYGDFEVEEDMIEVYEEDCDFDRVDAKEHVAYFCEEMGEEWDD